MPPVVYEIIALAMRYWFALLGVLIVWLAFSWLRKDQQQTRKRLKNLLDAGTIGVLTVVLGSDELKTDYTLPVPCEGSLGFLRTCDVVVPVNNVQPEHLYFSFENGKGLFIYPRKNCPCTVDGVELFSRRDGRRHPMVHCSVLSVGDAVLRLQLFDGLDVPAHALHRLDAWYKQDPWAVPEDELSPPGNLDAYPVQPHGMPPFPQGEGTYQSAVPPFPQGVAPPFPQGNGTYQHMAAPLPQENRAFQRVAAPYPHGNEPYQRMVPPYPQENKPYPYGAASYPQGNGAYPSVEPPFPQREVPPFPENAGAFYPPPAAPVMQPRSRHRRQERRWREDGLSETENYDG